MTEEILETDFEPWPKIARIQRDMIITEKIDGTNAQISVRGRWTDDGFDEALDDLVKAENGYEYYIRAGSRKKWIAPGKQDNAGFAGWVYDNAETLVNILGEGRHYGEWWGQGIQRKYDMDHKRFSLFNVSRWREEPAPYKPPVESIVRAQKDGLALDVVPVMYTGPFSTGMIKWAIDALIRDGSWVVPGFMDPEGIIIFHTAANMCFKQTVKGDDVPKGLQ